MAFTLDPNIPNTPVDLNAVDDEEEKRKQLLNTFAPGQLANAQRAGTDDPGAVLENDIAAKNPAFASALNQQAAPQQAPQEQLPAGVGTQTPQQREEKTTSTTTSRTKISKQAQAAHDALMGQMGKGQEAIRAQTDAAVGMQNADAEGKRQIAENSNRLQQEQLQRENAAKVLTDQRMAAYENAKQELAKNQNYEGLWARKSNGDRALAAISLAMTTAFQSRWGGPNNSLNILNSAMDDDYKHWQDRYSAMERAVARSGGDVDRARAEFDTALAARQVAQRQAVLDKAEQLTSQAKTAQQRAAGDALIQAQQEKIAEANSNFANLTNAQVHTTVNSKLTTGDGVNGTANGRAAGTMIQRATLAEHMKSAMDTIDRLTKEGVTLDEKTREKIQDNDKSIQSMEHASPLEAFVGRHTFAARSRFEGLSPKQQELANAMEVLSQKGAALASPSHSEEEMRHARGMFDMLTPGQAPDILAQKLDYSRGIMGANRAIGGGYSGIAERGAEESRAAAPKPGGGGKSKGRPFEYKGKRGYLDDENVFHVDGS